MNRELQIYIEGQRLELFQDEKITISSSIQNINDISKVFTDLIQSFTIPASPHNNTIFHHFYNSDVDAYNDEVFNYNIRKNATIEIDLTTLRTGVIQLEKANIKNGKPYSYTITFYGQLTSLKDLIGEDKLSDLDYTPYTHDYTGSEVVDRVVGGVDYDIRYPLISSERVWQYGSGSQNIGNSSHRIDYRELFPAIKINRIFDAIETKYGITLDGTIRLDKRFDNCFLFLKNKDVLVPITNSVQLDIPFTNNQYFDHVNNTVIVQYLEPADVGLVNANWVGVGEHIINVTCTPTLPLVEYYLDIYANGSLQATYPATGNLVNEPISFIPNTAGLLQNLTIYLRSEEPMTIACNYNYTFANSYSVNGGATQFYSFSNLTNVSNAVLTQSLDLGTLAPDMKIVDFLSGIIKEFNLTIEPLDQKNFIIESLEQWYNNGLSYDITKYTDIDSIDVERIKLYKKINFKHIESESFMNKQFKETNLREYGSLEYQFNTDGSEFLIELPFENLLFSKLATNLMVGYNLQKNDFKAYIPKPTLLYLNERLECATFYINDGATTQAITAYEAMGQDVQYNSKTYSLNFGNDISTMEEVPIFDSMFNTWYFTYINNLFQRKNRLTYVKTKLPLYILTQLRLNDRLIIRDHRYLINEMKIDLSNGVVDFVLLNDLSVVQLKSFNKVPTGTTQFKVPVAFPNGAISVTISNTNANGATIDFDSLEQNEIVTVTAPAYKPKQLRDRVLADGGTFEANTCLYSVFNGYYEFTISYNFPTRTTTEKITIQEVW